MKKPLSLTALLLASSLVIFTSCATSSISESQRKSDIANSKEADPECCFVKMNDGSIRQFGSLKLVTGVFTAPYLLADGKTKIKASQIIAYQNTEHYAVSQKTFCCGRKTAVATETLPGFAIRTAKGKLNIYCKKYYNGQVAADEYYIQAGNGPIQAYTPLLFTELIKDNAEALSFFTDKKVKGNVTEKLHATAQLYNGGQLVSKN